MKRIFIIMLIAVMLCGCSYKFDPAELEYIELHESTSIADWREDRFNVKHSIDFKTKNIENVDEVDFESLQMNITSLVNENGLQAGLYGRDADCNTTDVDPGIVEIRYTRGTIIIEQDMCNMNSTNNVVYDGLLGMLT